MAKRTVIEIDEDKCDGCGNCAGGCHEGALRIIDGKARLVGDSLCDGLGACIGECPRGAITVVEREAEEYDERKVIAHLIDKGPATLAAHLDHLRSHGQARWYAEGVGALRERGIAVEDLPVAGPRHETKFTPVGRSGALSPVRAAPGGSACAGGGCPGSAERSFAAAAPPRQTPDLGGRSPEARPADPRGSLASRLEQWPVQLHLVNPRAPYFRDADVLVAADCTAFACGAFHQALLANRKLVIACPKLDHGREVYVDKLRALIDDSCIRSITVAIMDVPCCGGLTRMVEEAMRTAKREVPVSTVVVSAEGGGLTWS